MNVLPNYVKIAIRIILLPIAFVIHLIPHIIGLFVNMYRWVLYGGEFIVYTNKTKQTISDCFEYLNKIKTPQP